MTPREKVDFIFGLHFHQPVGNFRHVLEDAYRKAYKPVIETFKKYDSIRMCLHISSPLLEYFKENHPGFLKTIKEEIDKGKIEIISGGFYEPILISIPQKDIEGQIEMTQNFVRENLGTRPRGLWLSERVWEPHLPSLLENTPVEYTAVDDTHFIQAGFNPEKLKGYFITEDGGNSLGIFSISKKLRYMIPFEPVSGVIKYFRELASSEPPMVCMLDDGEKFGVWPGTEEWVFGNEKWLDRFFNALEENSSWIKTRTLSEYYDSRPPLDRVYLPACQYHEMKEWSMPAEGTVKIKNVKNILKEKGLLSCVEPHLSGGIWRNYFSKYPESNYMNKKMLFLSSLLKERSPKMEKENLRQAEKHLYKAQCNCPYWHGVFGGIYLAHLRNAIYRNLNKLHNLIDPAGHYSSKFLDLKISDIDCDGKDEILIDTDKIFLCIKAETGEFMEISDKKSSVNLTDTIARRFESYHREITESDRKENGKSEENEEKKVKSIHDIEKKDTDKFKPYLVYDRHPRYSFKDHIIDKSVDFNQYKKNDYSEITLYNSRRQIIKNSCENPVVEIIRNFKLGDSEYELTKKIKPQSGERGFSTDIIIKKIKGSDSHVFNYACELNISTPANGSCLIYGKPFPPTEPSVHKNLEKITAVDSDRKISAEINSNRKNLLWRYPVNAVVNSLEGFELSHQGLCLTAVYETNLKKENPFSVKITFRIN